MRTWCINGFEYTLLPLKLRIFPEIVWLNIFIGAVFADNFPYFKRLPLKATNLDHNRGWVTEEKQCCSVRLDFVFIFLLDLSLLSFTNQSRRRTRLFDLCSTPEQSSASYIRSYSLNFATEPIQALAWERWNWCCRDEIQQCCLKYKRWISSESPIINTHDVFVPLIWWSELLQSISVVRVWQCILSQRFMCLGTSRIMLLYAAPDPNDIKSACIIGAIFRSKPFTVGMWHSDI